MDDGGSVRGAADSVAGLLALEAGSDVERDGDGLPEGGGLPVADDDGMGGADVSARGEGVMGPVAVGTEGGGPLPMLSCKGVKASRVTLVAAAPAPTRAPTTWLC
ncbi:hypothetical protein [Streptomyces blattellae]|uniref:hypothetical protein n=1 Tax=Streptomyces blattellae TaxID=2569855 RepID=UPI0012B74A56|nr:hypothetical protein [Streptomyces blattellae]